MNQYILIYKLKEDKIWDCCQGYIDKSDKPNFDSILSKILCTYCKIYDNAILIASKEPILEKLHDLFETKLRDREHLYILLKMNVDQTGGWTPKEHWGWINEFFKKEEKGTCMDKSISAFDYSEIK